MPDEFEDGLDPSESLGRRKYDSPGGAPGFCQSHSGTVAKTNLILWLLGIILASGAYQIAFQFPAIKSEVVTEVKGLTARIVELEKKDIEFTGQLREMQKDQSSIKAKLKMP